MGELAKVPGANLALDGLQRLPLKVCTVRGNNITLNPEHVARFEVHNVAEVHEFYQEETARHAQLFERLLVDCGLADGSEAFGGPRRPFYERGGSQL